MRIYHVTKQEESYRAILKSRTLLVGRNVSTSDQFVHVSLEPFEQGSYALDVIGADTNEAWIFECEIADNTALEEDPSGDGEHYNGGWKVCRNPIPITRIYSVTYIENVQRWEGGASGYAQKIPVRNR